MQTEAHTGHEEERDWQECPGWLLSWAAGTLSLRRLMDGQDTTSQSLLDMSFYSDPWAGNLKICVLVPTLC